MKIKLFREFVEVKKKKKKKSVKIPSWETY